MIRLKVGLVGVYRPLFKGDKLGVFARSVEALRVLSRDMDFELHSIARPASNLGEAQAAAREIQAAKVDLLLVQMSSFCGGDVLAPFIQDQTPLGLWAVPEPTASGPLPLNSLCGLNLYASVLGRKQAERTFKWFYGLPDDDLFLSRLRVTVRSLKAKKALAAAKIGLIGGHAPGFDNLAVDKQQLAARLGVQVCEHSVAELLDSAKNVSGAAAQSLADEMRRQASACTAPGGHVVEVARFHIALRDIAGRQGYDALAVRCWPEVPEEAGVMICAAMGGVADALPTACEGDVLGAAAMIALKTLTGSPPMLLDLSHVDEKDQSVLMWHCGNTPACWADGSGARLECHFNRDTMGAVRSMVFRSGPATVFQLSASGSVAFAFSGSFLGDRKPSFAGSRGWLGELGMDGAPLPVRDLLNTIFVHRLPHHFAIGAGDVSEEVAEFCAWMGLRTMQLVPYRDALQRP
jgi:L-fucose isomerase-like protein